MSARDLDLAMVIEVFASQYGDDFFHVNGRVVKRVWRDGEWMFDSGFQYDEPKYGSLRVSAQGNLDSEEPAYAWATEYHDLYRLTLVDAEPMVKVLRKVQRGLDKLTAEFGWPDSLGAYIARVGKILGANSFGFYAPNGEPRWASGELIRWDNASHLNSNINQRITALRKARQTA